MKWLVYIATLLSIPSWAQKWEIKNHPNNGKKAILFEGKQISGYEYTEVSELSEGKAYVAKGGLYAYIDSLGNELTPYMFTVAGNFTSGYAIIGDSTFQSIINSSMHLVVPFRYIQVRLPKDGLILVQGQSEFWGAYDTRGDLKIPLEYDLPPNILSKEKIIVRKEELYGLVNDCNEPLFKCNFQYITSAGYGYKKGKYLRLFKH